MFVGMFLSVPHLDSEEATPTNGSTLPNVLDVCCTDFWQGRTWQDDATIMLQWGRLRGCVQAPSLTG